MRISYDDRFLFSVGTDGSLLAFRVSDKDGRGIRTEKDIAYAEEVLVTKTDLEEKVCRVAWPYRAISLPSLCIIIYFYM